jgi:hypothetical protein
MKFGFAKLLRIFPFGKNAKGTQTKKTTNPQFYPPTPHLFQLTKLILLITLILTFTFSSCGDSGGTLGENTTVSTDDNSPGEIDNIPDSTGDDSGNNPGEPIIIPDSTGDDSDNNPGEPVIIPEITAVLYRGVPSGNDIIETYYTNNIAEAFSYVNANAGTYTLVFETDVSVSPQTLSGSRTLTLAGKGSERTITLTGTDSLFTVNSGVTLTLDNNITLKGHSGNNISLIYVYRGGTLNMRNGSKITGNMGGGVIVSGTFTMTGGTISNNNAANGGGVYVGMETTFTMSGGTISGNTANNYGGGVYVSIGTTFTMSGGTISGNTANNYGGGVYLTVTGIFNKTGGTIYGKNEGGNSNTATVGDTRGHAVYVGSSPVKYRSTTAGPTVNLNSANTTNWNQ